MLNKSEVSSAVKPYRAWPALATGTRPLEIVNVNFESKCSIYVQHNLLTLFNCSPRLLLLLFRTFWNCSVLLLFTYRIALNTYRV